MIEGPARERSGEAPTPAEHIDDRGMLSPEPAGTGDEDPDEALRGGSRPPIPPALNPAEERSE